MSLREEIKPYIDQYGLVQYKPGEGSGNGLLVTSLHRICEELLGVRKTLDDWVVFSRAVRSCEVDTGLFQRSPGSSDLEAMDDYVGLCAASPVVADWVHYQGSGQKFPGYNYNNVNPGKFTLQSWLGRMPHFPAHVQMAANEPHDSWRMPFWFGAVVLGAYGKDGDQDSKLMAWLLLYAAKGKTIWWKPANWIFQRRLKKQWGSLKAVVSVALGAAEHPIAKYWPENSDL